MTGCLERVLIRLPKLSMSVSIVLDPNARKEMRCLEVHRRVLVRLHFCNQWVEVPRRIQRDVVLLGDHPSDEPRSCLIADVPPLE